MRAAVEALVQAALEAEMTEAIGAGKGERNETRIAYRSGYYTRSLITCISAPNWNPTIDQSKGIDVAREI